MAPQPVHSKLLNQAVREVLRPLALVQRGRSRMWIDHHGWWIINVEFQPSSWSKGSYLNVGVQWLWHRSPALCFDFGYRVTWGRNEQFVEFHTPEQFAPEAQRLAVLAASKVQEYRAMFCDLTRLPAVLRGRDKGQYAYHIAMAHGLLGRSHDARTSFNDALIKEPSYDWHHAHNEQIREVCALLDDPGAFRPRVGEIVLEQRRILKLDLARAVELPDGATVA